MRHPIAIARHAGPVGLGGAAECGLRAMSFCAKAVSPGAPPLALLMMLVGKNDGHSTLTPTPEPRSSPCILEAPVMHSVL